MVLPRTPALLVGKSGFLELSLALLVVFRDSNGNVDEDGEFCYSPWNTSENRDLENIVEGVGQGLGLIWRACDQYNRVYDNKDITAYVI